MKARVTTTGDIIEISEDCSYLYAEHYDKSYNLNELEFLDVSEKSFPKDEDYWTRLEHQYAGMAMQGILANSAFDEVSVADIAITSIKVATSLIKRLKEERK